MSETDKKWLKKIVINVGIGAACGFIVKALMKLIVPTWTLLINFAVPALVVVALFVTLYQYNKEKENMLR